MTLLVAPAAPAAPPAEPAAPAALADVAPDPVAPDPAAPEPAAAAAAGRHGIPAPAVGRDAGVDLARAACLVVVFVLHAMMVGVSVGPDGPVLENAMESWAWFAPATWVVQVMPLFFVIGGYAGWTAWQRRRTQGGTAADFVRTRIVRLVRPVAALVVVVATLLAGLAAAGVPPELVATAGYRMGQPLWFLAVYLGATALVPAMAWLHARHPLVVTGALAAAVVGVDVLRASTGVEAIGFANLAFVWVLAQQGGFLLAEGRIDRMSRRARLLVAAVAVSVLLVLTTVGTYSPDLYENLNPPTAALVLLGVAQLMGFSIALPRLRRLAVRPRSAAVVDRFGTWGMTLYLWHLPVFVALAGGLLVLDGVPGFDLPVPLSDDWWASRPAWLVAAAVATAVVVRGFARFESDGRRAAAGRRESGGRRASGGAGRPARRPARRPALRPRVRTIASLIRRTVPVPVAVLAGILGVGLALVVGFAPLPAVASLALFGIALAGARVPATTRSDAPRSPATRSDAPHPDARALAAQSTRKAAIAIASVRGSHR
ncbi:acyltransferase [Agromyces sp. MMS24-JH15]|uniref:acyltransferase family protein n=1 Tax=Agromyces sp. MMS24-JH15 TaxID=3243765 RepID=UPI0037482BC0